MILWFAITHRSNVRSHLRFIMRELLCEHLRQNNHKNGYTTPLHRNEERCTAITHQTNVVFHEPWRDTGKVPRCKIKPIIELFSLCNYACSRTTYLSYSLRLINLKCVWTLKRSLRETRMHSHRMRIDHSLTVFRCW